MAKRAFALDPLTNLDRILSRPKSPTTYGFLLQLCGDARAINQGRAIHRYLAGSGLIDREVFVANHLVSMYGRCGCVDDARAVFGSMRKRNVVSWTAIIAAFASRGRSREALEYFSAMQLDGVAPNKVTFVTVLDACCESTVRLVDGCVVECGLGCDPVVGTALVCSYGRWQCFGDARRVFSRVSEADLILWNSVLAAHAGDPRGMFLQFTRMLLDGIGPDCVTFSTVVSSCSSSRDLARGKLFHGLVVESGNESDLFVGNALVEMYRKCGSIEGAREMFFRMERRDVITWNSLLAACVEQCCHEEALQLFRQMQTEKRVFPDKITFSCVLNACAVLMDLSQGRKVHECLGELGMDVNDTGIGTALVNMYGRCKSLDEARETFDQIERKDVATWTVMITALAEAEDFGGCLILFQEMLLQGMLPNKVTFLALLSGCGSLASLEEAKLVHSYAAAAGLESDAAVSNTIVSLYGKCGSIQDAELVFDKLGRNRDIVSWNAMMDAYAENEQETGASKLYRVMLLEGMAPDTFTFASSLNSCDSSSIFGREVHGHVLEAGVEKNSVVENALVSMYVKCGSLQEARKIFDGMEHRNVITWTAMVAAFAELGKCKETLVLFQKMQAEGVKPNKVTLSAIVNWCAQLGSDTKSSKLVEMCVEEAGLELELIVANALLNLYAKSARLRQAFRLFNRMPQRDSLSWNLVISSHAQHGFASESLLLFQRMKQEGMKPDGVTFLNIIAACGHCGEVEEGCRHFGCLEREYGISPTAEQRGCVVDLLGRAGRIVEAREFIAKNGLHSSVPAWMSVLGACRALGNVEEGKAAADKLVDLDPQNSASYVMLSNLYAR
ncbi:pentatricopeptide repeat-containing protein At3g20730 [Selaginella moellendorffii]|uniref:pentatricopeptide repeat-containing protein At3g20730 n=1 Tax=Selaginella moellendorffii TaxID=88036 RepID=UPI000D1C65A3|nr:pentatricopeptide repeat-containing protein At3g20730 [Selaginella moellendorffii]|eukprot:XP_024539627.1 pentatricopeptide repeat-containing protein At3g20730 [Selaginella moellendorffii]